jgi:hypothetical protein
MHRNLEQDMSTNNSPNKRQAPSAMNDKRFLHPTVTGELHSYRREELEIPEPSARQLDWNQDRHGQA